MSSGCGFMSFDTLKEAAFGWETVYKGFSLAVAS
jgi:hypothetical protein